MIEIIKEKTEEGNTLVFGEDPLAREGITKYEILQQLNQKKEVMIFDFDGKYTEFVRSLKGNAIEVKDGSLLNPLELFPKDGETLSERFTSHMLNIFSFLKTLFSNESLAKTHIDALAKMYNHMDLIKKISPSKRKFPTLKELDPTLFPLETYKEQIDTFSSGKTIIHKHFNAGSKSLRSISFQHVPSHLKSVIVHAYLSYFLNVYTHGKKEDYYLVFDDITPLVQEKELEELMKTYLFRHRFSIRNVFFTCSSLKTFFSNAERLLAFTSNKIVFRLNSADSDVFKEMFGKDTMYIDMARVRNFGAECYLGDVRMFYEFDQKIRKIQDIERFFSYRKNASTGSSLEGLVEYFDFSSELAFDSFLGSIKGYYINGRSAQSFLSEAAHSKRKVRIKIDYI